MGLKLVGYYQASDRLDDTSLVPVGEKIAGKIKEGFSDAVAFVVRLPFSIPWSSADLYSRSTETSWERMKQLYSFVYNIFNVFHYPYSFTTLSPQPYTSLSTSSSWRPFSGNPAPFSQGSSFRLASDDLPRCAVALVRDEHRHQQFGDFDDHLEDVSIGMSFLCFQKLRALTGS